MASDQPIIIKKIKKGGDHGHHGGAWKVAYADFVTAMMAFFLLMWLINTTTPEQKRGIADYFAPASVSPSESGAGGILGGTEIGEDGSRGNGSQAIIEQLAPESRRQTDQEQNNQNNGEATGASRPEASQSAMDTARALREAAAFQSAEMSLRQAMQDMPELAELSKHLIIEETPEGLRIQLVDQEGRPMFQPGSAEPQNRARTLLRAIGEVAARLPNRISISGHTDASASINPEYTNWELSADRANIARRLLEDSGLAGGRIYEIQGKAGSEPLFPDDPFQAGNRRISITLLREAPVLPPDHRL